MNPSPVELRAGGEALTQAIGACPYLVKPDTREHLLLGGTSLTSTEAIIEAGQHVIACGAEMVVISHDVTGDIAITPDAVWEIKTTVPTSLFKNLVGADDAFLAGILFKLAQDAPVEESLRFGLAAGIASAESEKKVCEDYAKVEAEMAKGLLESEEIPVVIRSDDCGGMYPQLQHLSKGVRLFVPAEFEELARDILAAGQPLE